MKKHIRGLVIGLSATAHAADRLAIELIPVWIYTEAGGELVRADASSVNDGAMLVHQALKILGVNADEYDLSVAPRERHQSLRCMQTKAGEGNPPQCLHPHDQPNEGWILDSDQILNLVYTMTGYTYSRTDDQGTIKYYMLLAPEDFAWGNTYYGVAHWWTWSDEPTWSTTSCQVWSNAWLYNVAHEIGHCFDLRHGGDPNDIHYDGVDDSMDLMSLGAHFYVRRLRESNRRRVRNHFGGDYEDGNIVDGTIEVEGDTMLDQFLRHRSVRRTSLSSWVNAVCLDNDTVCRDLNNNNGFALDGIQSTDRTGCYVDQTIKDALDSGWQQYNWLPTVRRQYDGNEREDECRDDTQPSAAYQAIHGFGGRWSSPVPVSRKDGPEGR